MTYLGISSLATYSVSLLTHLWNTSLEWTHRAVHRVVPHHLHPVPHHLHPVLDIESNS